MLNRSVPSPSVIPHGWLPRFSEEATKNLSWRKSPQKVAFDFLPLVQWSDPSDHQDYLISLVMAHHSSVTTSPTPPHHSTTTKLRAIEVRQWVGLKSSGCSHWVVTIECQYFYATRNVPSQVPLWHFEDRWHSHMLFTR